MFIIGIDPHKGSHTAAVIDGDETVVAQLSLRADRRQRDQLLGSRHRSPRGCGRSKARPVLVSSWPSSSSPRAKVVDVPPALSARARLLDAGRKDKNDSHDARSTAIVALRHQHLRTVTAHDHAQLLRRLARRRGVSSACRAMRDDRRRAAQESLG